MNTPDLTGVLFVVLSAALFSAKAVFAKLAYRLGADPSTVLTLRMAFALPCFAVAGWVALRRRAQRVSLGDQVQLFFLGSAGYYLAALFDFRGLAYVSAGLERLILFLYPTFVVAMGAFFRSERVTRRITLAMLLSYVGVALVVWKDRLIFGNEVWLGTGLVLLSAVAYAYYLSFSQPLIARLGSPLVTSYVLVVACLCVLLQFALEGQLERLRQPSAVYLLGLATGLLSTVIPAFLLTAGIRRLGASRAALLGTVGPVITLVLSYFFLHESVTWLSLVGAALVLFGVYLTQQRT